MYKIDLKNLLWTVVLVVFATIGLFISSANAQANSTINFQGKIVDVTDGTNLESTGTSCLVSGASNDTCDFRVRIYDAPSAGTLLFEENHSNVEIGESNGVFNLSLNSVCNDWAGGCAGSGITWGADSTIYIQIEFDPSGNGDFSEGEVFSRKLLQSVPYAYYADQAGSLAGIGATGFVQLQPASAQTATGSTALIWLNETGGSTPNLLELEVGGTDRLILDNEGNLGLGATFSIDVDTNTVRIGDGSTTDAILDMYASDGSTGTLSYVSDGWYFNGGTVGINTSPTSFGMLTVDGGSSTVSLWVNGDSAIDSVYIPSATKTSGDGLEIGGGLTGSFTNFTGNHLLINPTRNYTDAGTLSDTGNFLEVSRFNTVNNASATFNNTGDLVWLRSNCLVTSGTCTDSSNVLQLSQNYASATGEVLRIDGVGTGNLITGDTTNSSSNGALLDIQSSSTSQYAFRVTSNNGSTTGLNVRADGLVGIGTTAPTAFLDLAASTTGAASLNLSSSAGTNPTTPNSGDLWWNGTNLNFRTASSTVDLLAAANLFTDSGTITYLTSLTDDFAIGATGLVAPFSVDESANTVRIGEGSGSNGTLNMYASNGQNGSLFYDTGDFFSLTGGYLSSNNTLLNTALSNTTGGSFRHVLSGTTMPTSSTGLNVSLNPNGTAGTITDALGIHVINSNSFAVNVTNQVNFESSFNLTSLYTGTVSNSIGYRANNPNLLGGTITNNYGIYVDNQTSATSDYGIYIEGSDTYAIWSDSGVNKFDGQVLVGSLATPTSLSALNIVEDFAANSGTSYGSYYDIERTGTLTADTTAYGIYNTFFYSLSENGFNGTGYAIESVADANGTDAYNRLVGARNAVYSTSTSASQDLAIGSFDEVILDGAGTITNAYGSRGRVINSNSGTITNAFGTQGVVFTNNASANITTAYGLYGTVNESGGGTIATGYGVYSQCQDATTCYGLRVVAGDVDVATDWGIYVSGEDNNYLSSNIYLGNTIETISQAGFTVDGGDLFVSDRLGVEGSIYTDTNLIVGNPDQITALLNLSDSTTSSAQINFGNGGSTPSSLTAGDLWWSGTNLNFYNGSSTINLLSGCGTCVQLQPGSAQAAASSTSLIWVNETGGSTPNLLELEVAGTDMFTITNSGGLIARGHSALGADGVIDDAPMLDPGTTYSTALSIQEEYTDLSTYDNVTSISNHMLLNPSGATISSVTGVDNWIEVASGNTQNIGNINGVYGLVVSRGTGTISSMVGVQGWVSNVPSTTNNVGTITGGNFTAVNFTGGTVTNGTGLSVSVTNQGGTMTTAKGLNVGTTINTGTLTNSYGIFVGSQGAGSNSYGVYIESAGTYALWVDSGSTRIDGDIVIPDGNTTNVLDTAGNNLVQISDLSTNFGAVVEAGALVTRNSYFAEEFNRERADVAADTALAWGDDAVWTADEETATTADCVFSTVDDTVNGIGRMLGTQANANCQAYNGSAVGNLSLTFDADNLPVILMKVRPSAASANDDLFIGLSDTIAATATDPTNNGIYFTNNNSTTWVGRSRSASTNSDASCGVTISTTQFALLKIEVRATNDVRFYVDGDVSNGISWTSCGTVTTNIPTSGLAAYMKWESTTAARFVDVDFFRAWQDDSIDPPPAVAVDPEPTSEPVISDSTSFLTLDAATTDSSSLRILSSEGVDVEAPTEGDIWWNGTELNFYNGTETINLLGCDTCIALQPEEAQLAEGNTSLIHMNETGINTPNLIELEVDGNDMFKVSNSGQVSLGVETTDAWLDIQAATVGSAQINLSSSIGIDPTAPVEGDLWWNGSELNFYTGTKTVDLSDDGFLYDTNRQDNGINSVVGDQVVRKGWGFIQGNDTSSVQETVNFGITFNDFPIIQISSAGFKSGSEPTSLSECVQKESPQYSTASITNTEFTAIGSSDIFSSTEYYCYSWIAIGSFSEGYGADLAENYITRDMDLRLGEVVSFDENNDISVRKSNGKTDSLAFGIVSTVPAEVLGNEFGESGDKATEASILEKGNNKELIDAGEAKVVSVALEGRVPVKVSLENGSIEIGDYLSPASKAGYAMKSDGKGPIIGRALESFDGTSTLVQSDSDEYAELIDSANLTDAEIANIESSFNEDEGQIMVLVERGPAYNLQSNIFSDDNIIPLVLSVVAITGLVFYSFGNSSIRKKLRDLEKRITSLNV